MNKRFTIGTFAVVIASGIFAQTVNPAITNAVKALQGEQTTKAKDILLSYLAQTPADQEANYRLGNIYYQLGNKDSARYYFEKGIKPDDKVNYNFAGLGKLSLDAKDVVKADEYLNRLTGYGKSKDTKAYTFAGEAYLNAASGDLTKAIMHLEKAVTLNLANGEAQLLLGDAYLQSNNAGKAVTKYEYAIDADKTSAFPYMKIGQVYMKSGAYDQALKNFQKGNEIDPQFAPLFRELAEINYLTKNFNEACRLYKKYLDSTGEDIQKMTRYASFLFLCKDYQGTISEINAVLKQDSSNIILSRLIGYSYYEEGKYPEGLAFMKKFLEQADSAKIIGSDYAYYGKLLAKTNNELLAVVYLNRAIRADSANADLYSDLSQVLYSQKKYVEVIPVLEKMLQLRRGSSQDYFLLGKAYYYAAGNLSGLAKETEDKTQKKEMDATAGNYYHEADSAFIKVTEMQPGAPLGYLWRGRCNSNLDPETTEGLAFPYYTKFIELATDEAKYKRELIEANQYIGFYYVMKDDNNSAKPYWKKVSELEPGNKKAEEFFKSLAQSKP